MLNFTKSSVQFKELFLEPVSEIFDLESLKGLAKDTGLVKRVRAIHPGIVLKAFSDCINSSNVQSLANVWTRYNFLAQAAGGVAVSYVAFERFVNKKEFIAFTDEFEKLISKHLPESALSDTARSVELLGKLIPGIKTIIPQDGSEIRVNPLADEKDEQNFNGTIKPNMKLHASLSLTSLSLAVRSFTEGTGDERAAIDVDAISKLGGLLLCDAGYPSNELFFKLDDRNVNFIFKLKKNTIKEVVKVQAYANNSYVGEVQYLHNEVVKFKEHPDFKGQRSYDFVVNVKYKGKVKQFRLLKVFNPIYNGISTSRELVNENLALDDGYCYLLTNLQASQADVAQVYATYRLRWQVELYFKCLKQGNNLDLGKGINENAIKGMATLSIACNKLKFAIAANIQKQYDVNMSPFKVSTTGTYLEQELINRALGFKGSEIKDTNFERAFISSFKTLKKSAIGAKNRALGKGVACVNEILERPPSVCGDLSFFNVA